LLGHDILPVGVRLDASLSRTRYYQFPKLVKYYFVRYVDKMKKATNLDGYNLVLSHFMVDGKTHGAKSRMAEALGVTRSVADAWARNGIPPKYIPELKRITGLTGRQMQPETAAIWD
jgi:hypothetical protein